MKKTNWRRSKEYKEAKAQAFKPYDMGNSRYKCAFCPKIDYEIPYGITVFHLCSVGSHPALKMEPLNLLPVCFKHHRYYDDHPIEKKEAIEKHFPNRIQGLLDLERSKLGFPA